jgi:hypothetical protein
VSYARSDEITATFSAACDLRVIWGGDEAIRQIRRHPLAPHARDLTFPDRSSFTVISTTAWQDAPHEIRDQVARDFANDAYWFDQAACSSPRTVFWIGPPYAAKEDFTRRLAAAVTRGDWTVDAAMAVQQRVSTYALAADGLAGNLRFPGDGNAVATFDLPSAGALPRGWLGLGVFAHCRLASLDDLIPVVARKDQTMTHFGFPEPELRRFAHALAGRGVDRIVPIGSALTFAPTWDGLHLPTAFTRLVTIGS